MHLFWVSGITSVYSNDITSCPHVDMVSGIFLLPSMLTHPSSQHKGSEPEVIWCYERALQSPVQEMSG